MAKTSLVGGTTSYIATVFIEDSTSTTGAGKTGLAFNTASLTAYYVRPGAAAVSITLVTQTTTGAYSSGGFVEIDSANMPGFYRFDVPNAVLAAGVKSAAILLKGATGMAPLALEFEVTGTDNQDAVHGGMSALPNTACTTNASLLTSGVGTDQISAAAGVVKANLAQILGTALTETAGLLAGGFKKFFNVVSPTLTCLGVDQTGDNYARLGAPAGASHAADVAAVKADTAAVKVQTDKLTFTVANQVDSNVLDWKGSAAPAMTGDAFARLGAPAGASVSADVAAVKSDTGAVKTQTDKLTFTVANQIDANVLDWKSATVPAMTGDAFARLGAPAGASHAADIAAVKADTAAHDATAANQTTINGNVLAVKAKTDNLPASPAATGAQMDLVAAPNATALNAIADSLLKRDFSAIAGEAAHSVLNALRFLRNKWSVAAGTLTVTKEDGITTAWTGTVATDAAAQPVVGNTPS